MYAIGVLPGHANRACSGEPQERVQDAAHVGQGGRTRSVPRKRRAWEDDENCVVEGTGLGAPRWPSDDIIEEVKPRGRRGVFLAGTTMEMFVEGTVPKLTRHQVIET